MKRGHLLTMLTYMMVLFVCLTVSQPSTSFVHFTRLQQHLVTLYEQYLLNASAVDMELFMDARLMRRTHGVIDMIRGWAVNKREEVINVRDSLNYMRSVVLYTCVTYVDSLYDAFSSIGVAIDADIVLYASQIYRIRTNYEWQPQPCDPIVRFELMQFQRFALRARAVDDTPYVRIYSTSTISVRFFHDLLAIPANRTLPHYFASQQLNPPWNLHLELEMLIRTQRILLNWYVLHTRGKRFELRNQLYFMNTELHCILKELIVTFAQRNNITYLKTWRKDLMNKLFLLEIFQRYMQFVFAEYGRHAQHPAHLRYAHTISVNTTRTLNENHRRLIDRNRELTEELDVMVAKYDFLARIRPLIVALPLQVGYIRYAEQVTLRIGLPCQNEPNN